MIEIEWHDSEAFIHLPVDGWSLSMYKEFRKEARELAEEYDAPWINCWVRLDQRATMGRFGMKQYGFLDMRTDGLYVRMRQPSSDYLLENKALGKRKC